MRRDHRPYSIKKLYQRLEKLYVRHFLRPQFEHLGKGAHVMKPWYVEIFGGPVTLGDYATVIAAPDKRVRLSVWSNFEGNGRIHIGSYCLICPGVRMGAASGIFIADNCMIASDAYITDADWHDIYNRASIGKSSPVHIDENVWIGDRATICKGVHIGKNSIIGASAVVTKDVPDNSIAAGNPAQIVKRLDPDEKITTRSQWLADPAKLSHEFDLIDRAMLKDNDFFHWLRYLFFPKRGE
jgi:acetyltransferase-like isoleucine patch superfamily enzyme